MEEHSLNHTTAVKPTAEQKLLDQESRIMQLEQRLTEMQEQQKESTASLKRQMEQMQQTILAAIQEQTQQLAKQQAHLLSLATQLKRIKILSRRGSNHRPEVGSLERQKSQLACTSFDLGGVNSDEIRSSLPYSQATNFPRLEKRSLSFSPPNLSATPERQRSQTKPSSFSAPPYIATPTLARRSVGGERRRSLSFVSCSLPAIPEVQEFNQAFNQAETSFCPDIPYPHVRRTGLRRTVSEEKKGSAPGLLI